MKVFRERILSRAELIVKIDNFYNYNCITTLANCKLTCLLEN